MKKLIKILPIVLTVMMVFIAVSPVLATTIGGVNVDPSNQSSIAGNIGDMGRTILGVIQVVGTIAAVGVLMVVGIKYMMGSAEEKAEYKKVMIPYIIGAILLFAASNLASVVYDLAQNFTSSKP